MGAEALVRWQHPVRGLIPPASFIPIMEKNGFVTEVDFYVLESVCQLLAERRANGLPLLPISVNQSRLHLYDPQYIERLQVILGEHQIPPEMIDLEMTESVFFNDMEVLKEIITRIRAISLKVSIDDFGTGYSSLTMLKNLDIDILKLDREFFRDIDSSERSRKIIENIIGMARDLGITTVAEGVETLVQADYLSRTGCKLAQGYYFARPMPAADFQRLLQNQQNGVSASSQPEVNPSVRSGT